MDEEIEDRISRRRMVKRLGAATAVAWTAPVLSTLGRVPALSAQQRCPDCVPLGEPGSAHCPPLEQEINCGDQPSGNPCTCVRTSANQCFCHSCIRCDVPEFPPIDCTTEADCPAGWACALSCCSDPVATDDFKCVPPCEGGEPNPVPCVAAGVAAGGRTSMRL